MRSPAIDLLLILQCGFTMLPTQETAQAIFDRSITTRTYLSNDNCIQAGHDGTISTELCTRASRSRSIGKDSSA